MILPLERKHEGFWFERTPVGEISLAQQMITCWWHGHSTLSLDQADAFIVLSGKKQTKTDKRNQDLGLQTSK